MIETSFNLFDFIVITVVVLSALISFFRGFVRELLSLGAWLGAAIITMYTFVDVTDWILPYIKRETIASGLAAMAVFVISLLIISVFNALLMRLFRSGSDIGLLDNGLGLVFGLLRGALLVSLCYYMLSFVVGEEDQPGWLATAYTKPYVKSGALIVAKIAPEYLEEYAPLTNEDAPTVEDQEDTLGTTLPSRLENENDSNADGDLDWMNVEELEQMLEQQTQ